MILLSYITSAKLNFKAQCGTFKGNRCHKMEQAIHECVFSEIKSPSEGIVVFSLASNRLLYLGRDRVHL